MKFDYLCMIEIYVFKIVFIGWFDEFSCNKVMNWDFILISSLWDIDLKFFKENLWIYEDIWWFLNIYGYYCKFMSLLKLFMKYYEIYEVYMISIEKLMMFMKRFDMWKAISHIMMMDPLWSIMLRAIPMIWS